MKTTILDPQVDAELDDAAAWYDEQKEGLGAEFLDAISAAVDTVRRLPRAFPIFKNTSIRKFVLRRFPYVIFYEEFQLHISIYAVAHAKRKPGYWLGRVKDAGASEE